MKRRRISILVIDCGKTATVLSEKTGVCPLSRLTPGLQSECVCFWGRGAEGICITLFCLLMRDAQLLGSPLENYFGQFRGGIKGLVQN